MNTVWKITIPLIGGTELESYYDAKPDGQKILDDFIEENPGWIKQHLAVKVAVQQGKYSCTEHTVRAAR